MDEIRRVRVTNHMSASEAKKAIWRPGKSIGRTIYAQILPISTENDVLLGMVDYPELATHICDLHNKFLIDSGEIKVENRFVKWENKVEHLCRRCGTGESETCLYLRRRYA